MTSRLVEFATKRHLIWEARQLGLPQESWTDDAILRTHKFTNAFRFLDAGSQFVITDLIDDTIDEADQFARLFLYRHTGRPDAWRRFYDEVDRYPLFSDLDSMQELWQDLDYPVFTDAYIIRPTGAGPKLPGVIQLTKVATKVVERVWFRDARSIPRTRFEALRAVHGVGDFMAMQVLLDWNYRTTFRENDFIVAGPGTRLGAALLGAPAEAICANLVARQAGPAVNMPDGRVHHMSLADWAATLNAYNRYERARKRGEHLLKLPPYRTTTEAVPPIFPKEW